MQKPSVESGNTLIIVENSGAMVIFYIFFALLIVYVVSLGRFQ